MKKALLTAAAALTMFAMVACNNKKAEEPAVDTAAATEQCEQKCAHEGDSTACCRMAEGMDTTKTCCKEGKEGCQKAEGQKCCKGEGKECPKAGK